MNVFILSGHEYRLIRYLYGLLMNMFIPFAHGGINRKVGHATKIQYQKTVDTFGHLCCNTWATKSKHVCLIKRSTVNMTRDYVAVGALDQASSFGGLEMELEDANKEPLTLAESTLVHALRQVAYIEQEQRRREAYIEQEQRRLTEQLEEGHKVIKAHIPTLRQGGRAKKVVADRREEIRAAVLSRLDNKSGTSFKSLRNAAKDAFGRKRLLKADRLRIGEILRELENEGLVVCERTVTNMVPSFWYYLN